MVGGGVCAGRGTRIQQTSDETTRCTTSTAKTWSTCFFPRWFRTHLFKSYYEQANSFWFVEEKTQLQGAHSPVGAENFKKEHSSGN